jgi:transcriptional antiterminator RfaH
MERWFVIRTRPNAERQALWHLRNQGFEKLYLPSYRKRRSHARRIDWVAAPVFPQYLFVCMDEQTAQWRAIRSTVGIIDIVRNGNTPTPVPTDVIEALKAREGDDGLVSLSRGYGPGDHVQLCAGPFEGQVGLLECEDDQQRVTVLLNLLGRSVRVSVLAETVTRAA